VPEQEKNINKRDFIDLIGKNELPNYLKSNSQIEAIIHMGAISATTENNFNNLLKSNIRYSQFLWDWASANQVPLIYASSAATYGDGEFGYKDNSDALLNYKPLNAYGYSKHFFDMWVQNQLQQNLPKPPKWFGLKFFNVYGPNEYHKGRMASVVYHAFNQFKKDGEVRLFKSKNPEYKDGMQLRDFIYVKDAVRCIFHLLESTNKSGLYNIGTGQAQSFKDLANALLINLKEPDSHIKYVDMPKDLENKYQYYTEADIKQLRNSGYDLKFNNLLEGVSDYVQNYLLQPDQYA
jgi:ADP-L-glycero-D-manno-heptose 6-epimerase